MHQSWTSQKPNLERWFVRLVYFSITENHGKKLAIDTWISISEVARFAQACILRNSTVKYENLKTIRSRTNQSDEYVFSRLSSICLERHRWHAQLDRCRHNKLDRVRVLMITCICGISFKFVSNRTTRGILCIYIYLLGNIIKYEKNCRNNCV